MNRPFLWIALSTLLAGCGNGDGSGGGGGGGMNAGLTAEQHCLETLNKLRADAGVAALALDDKLNAFAQEGSTELAAGGAAHGHFAAAGDAIWTSGFCGGAAENQAPGWPTTDVNATVDAVIAAMMDEGPGGGHHDNILNKDSRLLGVGLVVKDAKLYFTNDFSPACK